MKAIILSGAVALVTALLGTPLFIRLMRRLGYGQPIRVEGLKSTETKRGTPTMGGAVFVSASLVGYAAGHGVTGIGVTASGLLVLMMMTGLAVVGSIDDFLKITRQTSLGLRSGAKVAGQVAVAVVFALEVLQRPDGLGLTPADPQLSFLQNFGPVLGTLPFVIWAVIMTVGASNAVNLADGLDGLATAAGPPACRRV